MGVSNTTSFSLLDVVTDLGGGETSLQECFDNAKTEGFDPTYNEISYAPANSLLRFRNYNYAIYTDEVVVTHDAVDETASFQVTSSGGVVDWGDGTTSMISSGTKRTVAHAYSSVKQHTITFKANNLSFFSSSFGLNVSAIITSGCPNLKVLSISSGKLASVDVTSNVQLTGLYLSGNTGMAALDISKNVLLDTITVQECANISTLSIDTNPLIKSIYYNGSGVANNIAARNAIYINLDNNGVLNGTIYDGKGQSDLTTAGLNARSNLIVRGWSV